MTINIAQAGSVADAEREAWRTNPAGEPWPSDVLLAGPEAAATQFVAALRDRPLFVCVAAYTATVRLPGISAAGRTRALREHTAAADLETLLLGAPRSLRYVPGNPAGAPGPVLITLAALRLAGVPVVCVDAGLPSPAKADVRALHLAPGGDVTTGQAVADPLAAWEAGLLLGRDLAAGCSCLIVAETVPGGTTTAQALLAALGLDPGGRVSSSFAGNNHARKRAVVARALAAAGLDAGSPPEDPLRAVAGVGDPMQPIVAGLAVAASRSVPVLLAGGTQMAAVVALVTAMSRAGRAEPRLDRIAIGTTRWVLGDPDADLAGLAREAGPVPVLAADLDFSRAAWPGLRDYERGQVKEGVGAGGAALAALCRGVSAADLALAVDELCPDLAPRPTQRRAGVQAVLGATTGGRADE